MGRWVDKAISLLFRLLLFVVPLIVFPKTSELFEFNKMVFTYGVSVVVTFLWITKMILSKKVIFKKTILDIPLLIFLGSQLLSTAFSIDQRTSLLGFYSRFHGGFLSQISYALLYWAYVANMDKEKTMKAVKVLFASGLIVSIWGILEHFGHSFSCLLFPEFKSFDVSCWVQDVQTRVFATFGQPNWLAAFIVAIIPLTWAFALNSKLKMKNEKFLVYFGLSAIFFLTLLYSGSRSGFLAFLVSDFLFWGAIATLVFKKFPNSKQSLTKKFVICHLSFVILALASGTPWTPRISEVFVANQKQITDDRSQITAPGPALEVGGTESGKIRQIVWSGALNIWKSYPILGTGVETFGFSYYGAKPKEHNLTTEWDFLYNKAHNEYLNFAATTGSVGLLTYLIVISFSAYQILKNSKLSNIQTSKQNQKLKFDNFKLIENLDFWRFGFFAGYVSILVTNFFGFSVVPVAILFFLFPAFTATLSEKSKEAIQINRPALPAGRLTGLQIFLISFLLLATCYLLLAISRYWYADYLYARAKIESASGNKQQAQTLLIQTTKLSGNEAVYWDELSDQATELAVSASEQGNEELAGQLASVAIEASNKAVNLSPANVNLKRNRASMFVNLSSVNPEYLILARQTLEEAVKQAPTDARLFYNWSLSYLRTGDYKRAIEIMQKTIDLKPNYRDARYALALMYYDEGEIDEAIEELTYILANIDPNDEVSRRELKELVE